MALDSRGFARLLLEFGAVKLSFDPPFTYTSGMKAPIYTDNRLLIGHVRAWKEVVSGFVDLLAKHHLEPDWFAGTSTAGVPWAAFMASEMSLPMVYVRPQPKAHGSGKQVEGFLDVGKNVIVVEDLVTTGGSSLKTVEALRREYSANTSHVMAIFTYGFQSMKESFAQNDVMLHTLTDFDTLLSVAQEMGIINDEVREKILDYKQDPAGWAKRMGIE
jgi:orotate phosphoribosyltransferase